LGRVAELAVDAALAVGGLMPMLIGGPSGSVAAHLLVFSGRCFLLLLFGLHEDSFPRLR
jgi:hypothetical protein